MPTHEDKTVGALQDEVPGISSPFQRALDEYVRSKDGKTPQFIAGIRNSTKSWTKDDVQKAIVQLEKEHVGSRSVSTARTVLRPVIRVLSDYASVIDTIAQADPMPTSVIWGSLRAVISCSTRFLDLYDKISDQLKALESQLSRLTEFEELFGESENMQAVLQKSYVDIIKFWVRVDKECRRCVPHRMVRSLASFSTSKLDGIVANIEKSADTVSALVPIVQERLHRGEREDAAEERRMAGLARIQMAEMFDLLLEDRKGSRLSHIRRWLQSETSNVNESNIRRHQDNLQRHSHGTCAWLSRHDTFNRWLEAKGSSAVVWLKAAPGMGKSVASAFAIDHIKASRPQLHCVFQYYSFDEEFTPIQVYRSIALQLVDHLWKSTEDIPEDIHKHAKQSDVCAKVEDAKTFIRMILQKLNGTCIFLDGLDEECESSSRWNALTETYDFLIELASDESSNLHLWCSSQDRAPLRSMLGKHSFIEIDEDLNRRDIELCLSRRISQLDSQDFDEGYKTLILADLLEKAKGCFLWASLVLDSISEVNTLFQVQQKISDGLPELYEDYYARKISRIHASSRRFVTVLLSCILYAKRPLRLDELSEATAAVETEDEQCIDRSQRVFKNKILKYCEPLVQVTEIGADDFEENPTHRITEEIIADTCLKYLWQPSYKSPLSRHRDNFCDKNSVRITDQPLLSYAAKYWDKHLDNVVSHKGATGCNDAESFCHRVKRFIHSPQFHTCLQVQSLLVEGQFQFWYASGKEWMGPQIKRVFPHWLAGRCLPTISQDYTFFVGEWGHILDRITSSYGPLPGEISRVFWSALGPFHFLRNGPGQYESFMLSTDHQPTHQTPLRYYDGINNAGDCALVLKLENPPKIGEHSELKFELQSWKLGSGSPEWSNSQILPVGHDSWCLYDHPLKTKIAGRPPPVDFTNDLSCIRIGSQMFIKSDEDTYEPFELDEADSYVEDVAISGRYLAVSRRKTVTENDLFTFGNDSSIPNVADLAEFLALKFEESLRGDHSTETTSPSSAVELDHSKRQGSSSATSMSMVTQAKSKEGVVAADLKVANSDQAGDPGMVEEIADKEAGDEENKDNDSDEEDGESLKLEESSAESDDNSAAMSWSEDSTETVSELDNDADWNDFNESDTELKETDLEDDDDSEQNIEVDDDSVAEDDNDDEDDMKIETSSAVSEDENEGLEVSGKKVKLLYREYSDEEGESAESDVYDSYDGSSEESDSEDGDGGLLDSILQGRRNAADPGNKRIALKVYDIQSDTRRPIFHFTHNSKGELYVSPPAFHPSKPLLVWPLGNNEILFADVSSNTYFTRLISCSTYGSTHVFIKAHFSADGQHVHFAALEAGRDAVSEDQKSADESEEVRLNLQITTHRLSKRKTTRVPPRLVFRTTVPLGRTSRLNVSDLPYSLTWRENAVYLTTRDQVLDVVRIPLFPDPSGTETVPIHYTQQRVYLPRTALSRKIHFIPADEKATGKARSRATVLIGSNCSEIARGKMVPKVQISPPIGVFMHEDRDLGGWGCRINKGNDEELEGKNRKAAGRLRDMWETFDLSEDCDIVPYLY